MLPFVFLGVAIGVGAASAAGDMPAFKVERWVNSTPLTADMLRGKVVLVDFWEYTCVNWIRTSPYVSGPSATTPGRRSTSSMPTEHW
jgi:hypothetical protein